MVMPMKKSNFIRTHLITMIFKKSSEKRKICKVPEPSFLYFDEPIQTNHFKIDRFGKGSLFFKDQILPIDWNSVNGSYLLEAYQKIKTNQFHVLKEVDGRFYKTRLKGKNVKK
jgi:hypothetical protein